MPDGGTVDSSVIDEITREIKSFSQDVAGLKDSFKTDLEAVRKLAEETKGSVDPLVRSQVEALSASVVEKLGAIQTQVDAVDKRAGRIPALGTQGEAKDLTSEAMLFHKTALSRRGQLSVGAPIKAEDVNIEDYRAWNDAFPLYLRRDERALDTKAMSVGSDPDGGYLVPVATSARILKMKYESSPMRALASVETIGTDSLEFPIDDGEFGFEWVGETEARSETTTSEVGVQRIDVHEMVAKPRVTQKFLEDASVDVEGWLSNKVAEKFGRGEATAFVSGNGVKKPRGFLTYASGTTRGTLERVASGAAASLTFDGLINTVTSLFEPYHANATWLMRRATEGSLLILKDGQGQYLWRPSLEAGKPSTLLGYPIRQAADMPSVSSGALPVAFGDFRMGYTIVDRLGIRVLRDPYSTKPFVEFYTRARVGGDVTDYQAIKLIVVSAS